MAAVCVAACLQTSKTRTSPSFAATALPDTVTNTPFVVVPHSAPSAVSLS